jgi:hypothetical protein
LSRVVVTVRTVATTLRSVTIAAIRTRKASRQGPARQGREGEDCGAHAHVRAPMNVGQRLSTVRRASTDAAQAAVPAMKPV